MSQKVKEANDTLAHDPTTGLGTVVTATPLELDLLGINKFMANFKRNEVKEEGEKKP